MLKFYKTNLILFITLISITNGHTRSVQEIIQERDKLTNQCPDNLLSAKSSNPLAQLDMACIKEHIDSNNLDEKLSKDCRAQKKQALINSIKYLLENKGISCKLSQCSIKKSELQLELIQALTKQK